MERKDWKFDALRLFFREDYTAKCGIVVRQPTLGDVMRKGESYVYSTLLSPWTGNPTSYRLPLWKAGQDWNKISEFELFQMLISSYDENVDASMLFPDIDFSKFQLFEVQPQDGGDKQIVMFDGQTVLGEEDYVEISQYVRTMFNIFPKTEKARDKYTKELLIWEDEQKLEKQEKEGSSGSMLLPLVSACVNHLGFKYKTSELKEIGIFEFMDSVQRLQIYENSIALLRGSCSGFVDASKIPKEDMNFMRDLSVNQ